MRAARSLLLAALTVLVLLPAAWLAVPGSAMAEEGDAVAASETEPADEVSADPSGESSASVDAVSPSAGTTPPAAGEEEYSPPGEAAGDDLPPGFGEAGAATGATTGASPSAAGPSPAVTE